MQVSYHTPIHKGKKEKEENSDVTRSSSVRPPIQLDSICGGSSRDKKKEKDI